MLVYMYKITDKKFSNSSSEKGTSRFQCRYRSKMIFLKEAMQSLLQPLWEQFDWAAGQQQEEALL